MQHSGGATVSQRLLRDQIFVKVEIKVGNQHCADYIGGKTNPS